MPKLPQVLAYVERLSAKGLDRGDIERIVGYVLNGARLANVTQQRQLLTVADGFGGRFDEPAARAWTEITGLPLGRAEKARGARVLDILVDRSRRGSAPINVDAATVRELRLPVDLMILHMARGVSPALPEVLDTLRRLERNHGNNDGVLVPRDLVHAGPGLTAIVEAIYRRTGSRALSFEQLEQELPAALATRLRQDDLPELTALRVRITNDVLGALRSDYVREVLGGRKDLRFYYREHGILHDRVITQLRRLVPEVQPEPTSEQVEQMYAGVLAARISAWTFYNVTGIDKEQLRKLQKEQPKRFPRAARLSQNGVLPELVIYNEADVARLSKAWRRVVAGEISVAGFRREHGVTKSRLALLRTKYPTSFPAPARVINGARRYERAVALAVAERIRIYLPTHILCDLKDLYAELSADPAWVARYGKIDHDFVRRLRHFNPDVKIPQTPTGKERLAVLARTARDVLAGKMEWSGTEFLNEMRRRQPRFSYAWLFRLRHAHPGVVPRFRSLRQLPGLRRGAEEIAAFWRKHPDWPLTRVSAELAVRRPSLGRAGTIRYTIRRFPEIFAGIAQPLQRRPKLKGSLAVRKVYELALRSAPPGAPLAELFRVINALLDERGLPPINTNVKELSWYQLSGVLQNPYGPREHYAAIVAEIVAEYASAAPVGASQEHIFARIAKDYPWLGPNQPFALLQLAAVWRKTSSDYPALARFIGRGELRLTGLGKPPAAPRFLGGWDPRRAFGAAPAAEQLAMAKLTEFGRLSVRHELLDVLLALYGDTRPLVGRNVLWVTHLLGDVYGLANALRTAGAAAPQTTIVGTPYGSHPAVAATLAADGFNVRVPALSMADYHRQVEKALDEVIARSGASDRSNRAIVVLDDGGLVAQILHSNPKYAKHLPRFRIVEQTTGGILRAEKYPLAVPVINVARSRSKRVEGTFVGDVIAGRLIRNLERNGRSVRGATVVVTGYGVVGSAVARAIERAGGKVVVAERNPERAKQAKRRFRVGELDDLLPRADIVIGATGEQSLGEAQLRKLKSGAFIASASSKRLEFDMDWLTQRATRRETLPASSPLVTLPTARYTIGGKSVTVVGDGWPINFDGSIQSVPTEDIQLTDAAMLAGALQAAVVTKPGLQDLEPTIDAKILSAYRAIARKQRTRRAAIYQAESWLDDVAGMAARFRHAP